MDDRLEEFAGVYDQYYRNVLRYSLQHAEQATAEDMASEIAALSSAADGFSIDAGDFVVERAAAVDALASLPDRDVEALTLVTWHGLGPAEGAEVVGCSARAFTARRARAGGWVLPVGGVVTVGAAAAGAASVLARRRVCATPSRPPVISTA